MTSLTTQPQSIPQPGTEGWLKGLPNGLENFPGGKWCCQSHWGIFFTNNGFVIKEFHLPVSILHFNQRHLGLAMTTLLKHTQMHRNTERPCEARLCFPPLWHQHQALPKLVHKPWSQGINPTCQAMSSAPDLCSKTALDPNTWEFLPGFSGIVAKTRGLLCT